MARAARAPTTAGTYDVGTLVATFDAQTDSCLARVSPPCRARAHRRPTRRARGHQDVKTSLASAILNCRRARSGSSGVANDQAMRIIFSPCSGTSPDRREAVYQDVGRTGLKAHNTRDFSSRPAGTHYLDRRSWMEAYDSTARGRSRQVQMESTRTSRKCRCHTGDLLDERLRSFERGPRPFLYVSTTPGARHQRRKPHFEPVKDILLYVTNTRAAYEKRKDREL